MYKCFVVCCFFFHVKQYIVQYWCDILHRLNVLSHKTSSVKHRYTIKGCLNQTLICVLAQVYETLKILRLQSNNGFDTRIFNDNGDGTAGYQIYVVALDEDGQYKKVLR